MFLQKSKERIINKTKQKYHGNEFSICQWLHPHHKRRRLNKCGTQLPPGVCIVKVFKQKINMSIQTQLVHLHNSVYLIN